MLLHDREGLHVTVSVQQAVLITTFMQVVVLPPDIRYVGVALNEVYVRSVLSRELLDLLGLSLVLLIQPRVFLFERVYLTLEC